MSLAQVTHLLHHVLVVVEFLLQRVDFLIQPLDLVQVLGFFRSELSLHIVKSFFRRQALFDGLLGLLFKLLHLMLNVIRAAFVDPLHCKV